MFHLAANLLNHAKMVPSQSRLSYHVEQIFSDLNIIEVNDINRQFSFN